MTPATKKATPKREPRAVKPKKTEPPIAPAVIEAAPIAPEVKPEPSVVARAFEGFIEATGRRKTSTATVRLSHGKKSMTVNGKDFVQYFPTIELQKIVESPLQLVRLLHSVSVSVLVNGGGIHSQAEAVRHAIARALVKYDAEFRTRLKKLGFMKRDPRAKERRKFGLKKARKSPQWSKR